VSRQSGGLLFSLFIFSCTWLGKLPSMNDTPCNSLLDFWQSRSLGGHILDG
jgi:hypothetical protein